MFKTTFFSKITFLLLVITAVVSCVNDDTETTEALEEEKIDTLEVIMEEILVQESIIGYFEQSLIDQGLKNIKEVDSTLMVDLKYSTTDNFFNEDVYHDLENAYLPLSVAERLEEASITLKDLFPNYRLIVFDAVRPHGVQKILWDALDSLPVNVRKAYVADPEQGSLHNYGCAVDLSIYNLESDTLLDMGTKYDYFGYLAYPRKEGEMLEKGMLNSTHIENRNLLRKVMKSVGFRSIRSEWWHFNSTSLANAKESFPLIE